MIEIDEAYDRIAAHARPLEGEEVPLAEAAGRILAADVRGAVDLPGFDRSSMDAFEDEAFRNAVEATGRKRLIFGALQTEVCLTFAVIEALKAGYEAQFVTDATGSRTHAEHRTAIDRLAQAGAVPNTAVGVVTELFRDWAGPLGPAGQEITNWYFAEVPKVSDSVGIAKAEIERARAAAASGDGGS